MLQWFIIHLLVLIYYFEFYSKRIGGAKEKT
jgi:hypothetical protein